MTHVHGMDATGDDPIERWSFARMTRHLREKHDVTVPMFWDIGRAHRAHLEAHQIPTAPEEAPVPEPHDHGRKIEDWHSNTDRRSVAYHLNEVHGIKQEDIGVREVYAQHARLHPMKKVVQTMSTADQHAEGQHQIAVDRVIAAMAGVSFDRDWASDSGMGPNGRGALRMAYQDAAERLLAWIRGGGILEIEPIRQLSRDLEDAQRQLEEITEDRDSVLETCRTEVGRRTTYQRQLAEAQSALQQAQSAALGSVTTRQLLDELTSRIDLGHCGLDYPNTEDND